MSRAEGSVEMLHDAPRPLGRPTARRYKKSKLSVANLTSANSVTLEIPLTALMMGRRSTVAAHPANRIRPAEWIGQILPSQRVRHPFVAIHPQAILVVTGRQIQVRRSSALTQCDHGCRARMPVVKSASDRHRLGARRSEFEMNPLTLMPNAVVPVRPVCFGFLFHTSTPIGSCDVNPGDCAGLNSVR